VLYYFLAIPNHAKSVHFGVINYGWTDGLVSEAKTEQHIPIETFLYFVYAFMINTFIYKIY